ncbi:MAG: DUF6284 family protein [Micromonosporaceae bacterium]
MPTTRVCVAADDGQNHDGEPTPGELAVLDREAPILAAEWELLHAELACQERPRDARTVRRVQRARLRVLCEQVAAIDAALVDALTRAGATWQRQAVA